MNEVTGKVEVGIEEEEGKEEAKADEKPTRDRKANAAKLSPRAKEVLKVLREARMLSQDQVGRLFFQGRHESAGRKRMKQLQDLGLLERHVLRHIDRPNEVCWSLSDAGETLVARWTRADGPVGGPTEPDAVEHHLFFTELYVGLLASSVDRQLARVSRSLARLERQRRLQGIFARADHPAWGWRASGPDVSLPWREYVNGPPKDRLIRPDALLALPPARVRVFVEGETGSQPVRSRNKERFGATVAKLDRYLAYVTTPADVTTRRTWYQDRFTDGFAPELLVLLPAGRRLVHVEEAVAEWRKAKPTATRLPVKVLTVDEAVRHYAALAGMPHRSGVAEGDSLSPSSAAAAAASSSGLSPASSPALTVGSSPATALASGSGLTPADRTVLAEFFQSVRADLKRRQGDATRLQAQQPGRRVAMPVVPARYEEMKALVARLTGGEP